MPAKELVELRARCMSVRRMRTDKSASIPAAPLNWKLNVDARYAYGLKNELSANKPAELLSALRTLSAGILTNTSRNKVTLNLPTNSLFIEGLPATKGAEARTWELDTVRVAARIRAAERGDRHIDRQGAIEGGIGVIVPLREQ